jgi:hypothetical protein
MTISEVIRNSMLTAALLSLTRVVRSSFPGGPTCFCRESTGVSSRRS